jgi:hypothetical protein
MPAASRLANVVDFHSFTLSYLRQINPDLSFTGQVGLVGVTSAFSLGLPKTLLPTYSFSATWTVTPKVGLMVNASRTVAPPTTIIANAETSYLASASLTYQATPKLSFATTGSIGYSNAAFTPALTGTVFAPYLTVTHSYTATTTMTYAMTPFITAALAAVFSERVYDHFITPQDIITLSLNYKPH